MQKVLITGATGFIGSWLVNEMLSYQVEVIAVVRESYRTKPAPFNGKVKTVYCDMENYSLLPSLIEERDIDTAYHLAWKGVSGADLTNSSIQISNLKATLDFIEAIDHLGCKSFVGAGSLHELESIYEMAEGKPICNQGYMYKGAKIAAHCMGKALAGSKNIKFFWPIISNAYGEGEHSQRLVNSVIRTMLQGKSMALTSGLQLYDFIHISDVVYALYLIGERGVNGRNYFIGSGDVKPLKKYLCIVEEIVNKRHNTNIKLGFGQIPQNGVLLPKDAFDNRTLVKDTGFTPKISFEEGIYRTVMAIENEEKIFM